jgi:hypothetical protein
MYNIGKITKTLVLPNFSSNKRVDEDEVSIRPKSPKICHVFICMAGYSYRQDRNSLTLRNSFGISQLNISQVIIQISNPSMLISLLSQQSNNHNESIRNKYTNSKAAMIFSGQPLFYKYLARRRQFQPDGPHSNAELTQPHGRCLLSNELLNAAVILPPDSLLRGIDGSRCRCWSRR